MQPPPPEPLDSNPQVMAGEIPAVELQVAAKSWIAADLRAMPRATVEMAADEPLLT